MSTTPSEGPPHAAPFADPSSAPPPPFTESQRLEPPGGRDPGGAKLMLTWLALIVAAALLFVPANIPTGPAPVPEVKDVQSWQLRFMGRYAVGTNALGSSLGASNPGAAGQLVGMIEEQFDQRKFDPTDPAAKREHDVDYLRATAILAELTDAEQAMKRLDEFTAAASFDPELNGDAAALRAIYSEGPAALDDDQKKLLRERHGWFADLALTFGAQPADPARAGALSPCYRALFGVLTLVGVLVIAGLAGFVLLIVAIVLGAGGKLQPRFQRDIGLTERENRALLETPVVLLLGLVLIHAAVDYAGGHSSPAMQALAGFGLPLQFGLAICVLWPLLRGFSFTRLLQAYGWHFGRGLFRELGAGFLGYLAGLPIVAFALVVTFILLTIQTALSKNAAAPSHPIVESVGEGGVLGALAIYALASGWAPFVEETTFRGAFYRHLRRWVGPVASGMLTGFFFAVVHPQGWATVPVLMALGFVFAMLREWRGSLVGPMLAHALHNGFIVTLILVILV